MHRPRVFRFFLFALLLLILPHISSAATRTVRQDGSGDYLTINAAVAVALANDIIEVGPGVYHEQVDVLKTLAFVSTSGAAATVIEGDNARYVLWFRAGVGSSADGFTFAHGQHISGGGAIRAQAGATATLKNCVIENCHSDFDGGGIFTRDAGSFLDVYDCIFRYNRSEHNGSAGIAILGSRINYTRCTFYGHTSGEQNAGTSCDHSFMDIKQCLYYGNSSDSFSPIYYFSALGGSVDQSTVYGNYGGTWGGITIQLSTVDVTRCIIGGNTGGYGIAFLSGAGLHSCNVFFNNASGHILASPMNPTESVGDPLFCDPSSANYHINSTSPAAASHNSCAVLIGALDVACGPLAVAISSFEAKSSGEAAILHGTFQSSDEISAVNVYRGAGESGRMVKIASVGAVDRTKFEYTDRNVTPGTVYRYQIGVIDGDGEFMSQIQRVAMPALKTGVQQNYPNPFNPQTAIRFTLSASEHVELVVYDAAGRVVRTLVNETRAAGNHDVTWDGRNNGGATVASGVYFYRFHAGKISETKRMVMLK